MMKQAFLVARRELRSFFDQPTAYVLAVAFLGLGLYMAFRSLYAMSAASLRPFFDLLPWLLVVFIPAVAMKSLAEERRGRTLEWLIAQPLTETEIVLGKFLGSWLFVMITLAGTLPMALGVLLVSEADPGIMVAQYVGAALLAAQMIAIGIWASSMTRNQITAFILGAITCFALVLIGTPIVQIGLPRLVGSWAAQLSVISHFENVARGVVDLRDLLYFASTCGLFLLLAVAALGGERLSRAGDAFRRLRLGTGVIALAVLMLNLVGGHVRGRIDLTRDDLFTLSDGSRDILGSLDDVVNLTFFVSDDLPQEIQLTERDVRDLVADLENASNGMLVAEEVNPDDSDDAADQASSVGVMPIEFNVLRDDELQVKRGYFGLAVTYADEQEIIPVIDRADDLEFRLVSAIANMTNDDRPTLAFMSGFEAKDPFYYRSFRESIGDRYGVVTIDIENDSTGALRTRLGRRAGGGGAGPAGVTRRCGRNRRLPGRRWRRPPAHGAPRTQSPVTRHVHARDHRSGTPARTSAASRRRATSSLTSPRPNAFPCARGSSTWPGCTRSGRLHTAEGTTRRSATSTTSASAGPRPSPGKRATRP